MPQAAGFLFGALGLGSAGITIGAAGTVMGAWASGWMAGAAAGVTGLLGKVAIKLLGTVALSALSVAMQAKPKASGGGITTSDTLSGETNPETLILGKYATAGQAICPPMSHGGNNYYLTHVIELCSAPGATLDRVIINNDYVVLGDTPDPYYGRPVVSGAHSGLIWIKFYDGSQTTADENMVYNYGHHPDRPWTTDMIGRGICYAILTFKFDQKRLTSVPRYLFEMTGIPLYDPRQDSTAGGSGPQRWQEPSTWTQSTNAIVAAYNIMRGIRLPGGDVWGGKVAVSDLPMAGWMAAMNTADLGVDDGAGGIEPQYRFGYEARLSDEPADVLEEILKAASANIADIGGTWKVRAGAPNLPVMAISDRDILVSKETTLDPFPGLDLTYNGITATFPDPSALWQSKEAPARYNPTWEAADRFGRKIADVQLPAVPFGAQVQRLMLAWIEGERRFRAHKFTLPPSAAALEPLDTIAWSSLRNGYAAKLFEISETVDDLMICCPGQSLKEVDPADYAWSGSMILPSTPSAPGYTPPMPTALAGWTVAGDTIRDADDAARRVALRLSWDPDTLAEGITWEIRVAGSGVVLSGSTQAVAAGTCLVSDGILPDTSYEARALPVGRGSEWVWTSWASASTDPISLSLADLSDDLRRWLAEMQAWIDGGTGDLPAQLADLAARITAEETERAAQAMLSADRWRDIRETVRAMQAEAIDLAAADHAARGELRRGISVELAGLRATYDDQIVTLADAGRVASLRIETLDARSVDQGARIQQVSQAQIDGDDALAALITGLAVGNATQFDQAAIWYFDASAEGWTGAPSAPTSVAGGFIRPASGSGTYIVSPQGLDIAAGTYSQVRLRLQRTGTPAWTGYLWWAGAGETWDLSRRVNVAAPIWSGDEGLVTIQPGWSGVIDRIRLDLVDNTASDYALIDWLAIGRPAPGASSADLAELRQAMTTADTALAQSVTQLQANLATTQGTATGAASAVDALAARVTETEDGLGSVTESVEALQAGIADPATGLDALADAIDRVRAETQTGDGSQIVQSEAIRALTSRLRMVEAEGLDAAMRDHAGRQDLRDYIATASQSLSTRIDVTGEAIQIVADAVTSLKSVIPGLATTDALQALRTIVTQQAGAISANSSYLVNLQSVLDALTGVVNGKASASALTALTSRVLQAEGDINAQSEAQTALDATVGRLSASGLFRVTTEVTPTGAQARLGIKVAATNGEASSARAAAFYLDAIAGGASRAVVQADRFAVTSPDGLIFPLIVADGKVLLNNAVIGEAAIQRAHIGALAVDTFRIAERAVSVQYGASGAQNHTLSFNSSVQSDLIIQVGGLLGGRIIAHSTAADRSEFGRLYVTLNGVTIMVIDAINPSEGPTGLRTQGTAMASWSGSSAAEVNTVQVRAVLRTIRSLTNGGPDYDQDITGQSWSPFFVSNVSLSIFEAKR